MLIVQSNVANKIKPLNIKKSMTISVVPETLSPYTEWFRENSLIKTRNFATLILWLIFPSKVLAKSLKLHKRLKLIR